MLYSRSWNISSTPPLSNSSFTSKYLRPRDLASDSSSSLEQARTKGFCVFAPHTTQSVSGPAYFKNFLLYFAMSPFAPEDVTSTTMTMPRAPRQYTAVVLGAAVSETSVRLAACDCFLHFFVMHCCATLCRQTPDLRLHHLAVNGKCAHHEFCCDGVVGVTTRDVFPSQAAHDFCLEVVIRWANQEHLQPAVVFLLRCAGHGLGCLWRRSLI